MTTLTAIAAPSASPRSGKHPFKIESVCEFQVLSGGMYFNRKHCKDMGAEGARLRKVAIGAYMMGNTTLTTLRLN